MTYRPLLALTATFALVGLAACGSGQDTAGTDKNAITATDSACQVTTTSLPAGRASFQVTNSGSQVTEVYIYGQQDGIFTKIIAEVEDVGPGTSRDLSADLSNGVYEIACKPGQTGKGIRTQITVTGGMTPTSTPSDQAAYDREIKIEVAADGIEGADGLAASAGQKIEFELENKTSGKRELEVIDPSGKIVAEIEADPSGEAKTIVTLGSAGAWTLKIEGDGSEVEKKLTVA